MQASHTVIWKGEPNAIVHLSLSNSSPIPFWLNNHIYQHCHSLYCSEYAAANIGTPGETVSFGNAADQNQNGGKRVARRSGRAACAG